MAIGAVIEEEITVRDEKPFFAAGSVYREYVGRPVPVLRTRIVIDAPESLPLKRISSLLPNAQVRRRARNGRVRWTLEQGAIDEMAEMESNLPPTRRRWPSVEFSSGASWEAVASVYRDMTEGAHPQRRCAAAARGAQVAAADDASRDASTTSRRSSSACIARCATPASSSARRA